MAEADPNRSKGRSRQLHPGIALAVVSFFVSLILCEFGLRLFWYDDFPDFERMSGESLGYDHSAELGWFPAANSRRTADVGRRTILMAHNSQGFRDVEQKSDHRPAIVFLGDSFVWGYHLDATERFTEKLRANHQEWRICNFGVVGYGTDQEFLLLKKHFQEYRPRVVFLVFCTENDYLDNKGNGGGRWAFKPYFSLHRGTLELKGVPVPKPDWVFCLEHPVLSSSYLVRLVMRAWGKVRLPAPPPGENPTKAILKAIRDYVTERGAIFCVGLTSSDAHLQDFLETEKILHLDLSTSLRLENEWHWSPEGNSYVAHRIEDFFMSNRMIQPFLGGDRTPGASSSPTGETRSNVFFEVKGADSGHSK